MACARMTMNSGDNTEEEDDDVNIKLKVCVVNKACGVTGEEDGVSVSFECDEPAGSGASKLALGLVALAATAFAF